MVAGDCAFPINFESSANSVVVFVVIAGIIIINKQEKQQGPQNGTLRHSTGFHMDNSSPTRTAIVVPVITFQIMLLHWPVTKIWTLKSGT